MLLSTGLNTKGMENSEDRFLEELESVPSGVESQKIMTTDDIDRGIKLLELEYKKEELESRRQDRKQRGKFSIAIFSFMGIYMLIVVIILMRVGNSSIYLSDKVIISLLTTTTAEIIGIFTIVAKYLFHK